MVARSSARVRVDCGGALASYPAVVFMERDPSTPAPRRALAAGAKRGLTRRRKTWALVIAGASDLMQVALTPLFVEGAGSPFEVALDAVTALTILLVAGFHLRLAVALVAELVPGIDVFPTWTALVATLPVASEDAPDASAG